MREAVLSLLRNRLMSFASIATVMSCMLVVSFSYCLAANVDYFLEQMESSLNLSVYLRDDLPPENLTSLSDKIHAISHVNAVIYVSSEQALEDFRGELGDDQGLLEGIPEDKNPLPRSFNIALDDIKNRDAVVSELEKLRSEGVEEIKYDEQIINAITTINNGIRIVSVIIIFFLIIVSIVIIMNTIKITVNTRRMEIQIMKYIGATDWFIRWPFIIEGILIGLIGALIPITICWFGYNGAVQAVFDRLKMLENLVEFKSAVNVFLFLAPMSVALGVLIGSVGSVSSLRRHLNA
jgi:cell division transport system permease protein